MSGSVSKALSRVQHERRFAEITASFNGLNLKTEYPELNRDEQGAVIRAAKRRVALGSPSPVVKTRISETATAPPGPTTPPTHRSTPESTDDVAEPNDRTSVTRPHAPAYSEGTWTHLMGGTKRSSKRSENVRTLVVISLAALALGAFVAWDQWQTDDRLAGTDLPVPEPRADALTPEQTEAGPRMAADPSKRRVQEILARHQDKLEDPQTPTEPSVAANLSTDLRRPAGMAAARDEPGAQTPADTMTVDLDESGNVDDTGVGTDAVAAQAEPAPPLIPARPEPELAIVQSKDEDPSDSSAPTALAAVTDSGEMATAAAQARPAPSLPVAADARPALKPTEPPEKPAVPYNARVDKALVLSIQQRLKAQGYDPGPLDGIMGWRTYLAIRAFQQAKGLRVDGQATEILLGSLVSYAGRGGN